MALPIDTHIAAALLDLLCCPETRQPLRVADGALLTHLEATSPRNRRGDAVPLPLEGGLIRQDGEILYPLRQGIPVLLLEEGIPISPGKVIQ